MRISQVPIGTYGRIAPRSGLAVKHGIGVGAGVIDRDYRGEIGVVFFNHSGDKISFKQGDRVAQLILERYAYDVDVVELHKSQDLPTTARGQGGYGSTGLVSDITSIRQ